MNIFLSVILTTILQYCVYLLKIFNSDIYKLILIFKTLENKDIVKYYISKQTTSKYVALAMKTLYNYDGSLFFKRKNT